MKNFRWKMFMIMALMSLSGNAWSDTGHGVTESHQIPQMNYDKMPGMMREGMLAMPQMDPARGPPSSRQKAASSVIPLMVSAAMMLPLLTLHPCHQ